MIVTGHRRRARSLEEAAAAAAATVGALPSLHHPAVGPEELFSGCKLRSLVVVLCIIVLVAVAVVVPFFLAVVASRVRTATTFLATGRLWQRLQEPVLVVVLAGRERARRCRTIIVRTAVVDGDRGLLVAREQQRRGAGVGVDAHGVGRTRRAHLGRRPQQRPLQRPHCAAGQSSSNSNNSVAVLRAARPRLIPRVVYPRSRDVATAQCKSLRMEPACCGLLLPPFFLRPLRGHQFLADSLFFRFFVAGSEIRIDRRS
eukprot:COSAG01_NODE_1197_length_11296_cov_113.645262_4_plen_258_part_00